MATKWKVLGIRMPEDSDFQVRLKILADDARMSYFEFLEVLISQAENKDALPTDKFNSTKVDELVARMARLEEEIKAFMNDDPVYVDFEKRISVLESDVKYIGDDVDDLKENSLIVDKLENRINENTQSIEKHDKQILKLKEVARSIDMAEVDEFDNLLTMNGNEIENALEKAPHLNEIIDISSYIFQLHEYNDLSLQQIADKLNSENKPTLSGVGKWHKGSVVRILKKIKNKMSEIEGDDSDLTDNSQNSDI